MDKKSILELGVGTGVLGERVKSLVPSTEIDGLDISSEMLKRSKEKAVYNHLYLGSADEHLYTEQYAFVYSAFSQRWNVYTCGFDSKYEDIS